MNEKRGTDRHDCFLVCSARIGRVVFNAYVFLQRHGSD